MTRRGTIAAAALLGALGVGAGAFGAHALAGLLDPRAQALYETGVRYQLWHALAALAGACGPPALWRSRWCRFACLAWLAGGAVFSASLYLLALGAPRWLGAVTPLGGFALICGWLALALAALRTRWADETAAHG